MLLKYLAFFMFGYLLGLFVAAVLDGSFGALIKRLRNRRHDAPAEFPDEELPARPVLDPLYSNMFWVYPEDVEDFLIWVLKNHATYGRFLSIDEYGSGRDDGSRKLCVRCYSNDLALVEAELAAGYPFAMVEHFSGEPDDEAFMKIKGNVDALSAEDRKHVAFVVGSDGGLVYLCVDHNRQDLLRTLRVGEICSRPGSTIQKGDCE